MLSNRGARVVVFILMTAALSLWPGQAGGAPGMNALLESDGNWTVIITANVDAPLPECLGVAIAKALKK